MIRLAWMAIIAAMLTGCATNQPLYLWGSYEALIYSSYAAPGSVPPELQVEKLEQDYQRARAANARVPPGWHAHLGNLYAQLGRMDAAQQELQTEKAEFPEATAFVDKLLANLGSGGKP